MKNKLDKHRKAINERYLNKKSRNKTSYFTMRLFLASVTLLLLSILSRVNIININNTILKEDSKFNFIKIAHKVNSILPFDILNSGERIVYSSNFYENVEFISGVNIVKDSNYAIRSLTDGVVNKITRHDGLFDVDIKTIDDYVYKYQNVESIDVSMYQYVKSDEIIGKMPIVNSIYSFNLVITKDDKVYSYYEKAKD